MSEQQNIRKTVITLLSIKLFEYSKFIAAFRKLPKISRKWWNLTF